MARNRDATKGRIVQALGRLLAKHGFQAVGLRAVAREAGVDKRLVSRYFGDVAALIAVYAQGEDFWWSVDELIGDNLPAPDEDTPAGWWALVLKRHIQALRQRPLTQAILVWELSERNALTDELARVREVRARELLRRLNRKCGGRGRRIWNDVGALIAAGTTYLVLRARTFDTYAEVDLAHDAGWQRFADAIDLIARGVCGAPAGAPAPGRTRVGRPQGASRSAR